jgi:hypothetical protein
MQPHTPYGGSKCTHGRALGPQYFRECVEVIDATAGGAPDRARLAEIMRRHGLTLCCSIAGRFSSNLCSPVPTPVPSTPASQPPVEQTKLVQEPVQPISQPPHLVWEWVRSEACGVRRMRISVALRTHRFAKRRFESPPHCYGKGAQDAE